MVTENSTTDNDTKQSDTRFKELRYFLDNYDQDLGELMSTVNNHFILNGRWIKTSDEFDDFKVDYLKPVFNGIVRLIEGEFTHRIYDNMRDQADQLSAVHLQMYCIAETYDLCVWVLNNNDIPKEKKLRTFYSLVCEHGRVPTDDGDQLRRPRPAEAPEIYDMLMYWSFLSQDPQYSDDFPHPRFT